MAKFFSLLLIFVSVTLGAQTPPPTNGTANPSAVGKGKDEPTGEEKISEIQSYLQPFEYNREELRDPFETQGSSNPLEPGQVYGPFLKLQNYRLSQFKLKGLMWGNKNPVAVFQAPDGESYRLKIKDYIGENFGYIAMIREREVVVIQTIEENNKRYSTTKVVFLE